MSEQANQGIVLGVVEAYQAVLYAQRRVDVAQHEETTAEALLADAKTKVHAGLALIRHAGRASEFVRAAGGTHCRRRRCRCRVGTAGSSNGWDTISPRPTLQPIEARSFPEGVLADDIASALKAKPDLKALRQQTLAQAAAAKAARDGLAPDGELLRQLGTGQS